VASAGVEEWKGLKNGRAWSALERRNYLHKRAIRFEPMHAKYAIFRYLCHGAAVRALVEASD
jgi:hypothetical protein